jgi:hypothetical protein
MCHLCSNPEYANTKRVISGTPSNYKFCPINSKPREKTKLSLSSSFSHLAPPAAMLRRCHLAAGTRSAATSCVLAPTGCSRRMLERPRRPRTRARCAATSRPQPHAHSPHRRTMCSTGRCTQQVCPVAPSARSLPLLLRVLDRPPRAAGLQRR